MTKTCVLHFNGFPGTGKLTIARELAAQAPDIRLIDNHMINNPIFAMLRIDGKTKISQQTWDAIRSIRNSVTAFLSKHADPSLSFIFTSVLAQDDLGDLAIYNQIKQASENRGSSYIPVTLTCDFEENQKRITHADRGKNMKMTDPEGLFLLRQNAELFIPDHPNLLELDVTKISSAESAGRIKDHALRIMAL